MPEIAELLNDTQQTKLERDLAAMYGIGDSHDPLREAKELGLTEILARDIPELRELEWPLDGHYVRLHDGKGGFTACVARKINKWLGMGFVPVEELE